MRTMLYTVWTIILGILVVLPQALSVSETQFVPANLNGDKYLFSTTQVTRMSAKTDCEKQGATLTSILNHEENAFITNKIKDIAGDGATTLYWLGLMFNGDITQSKCYNNTCPKSIENLKYRELCDACINDTRWLWEDVSHHFWTNWNYQLLIANGECVTIPDSDGKWCTMPCNGKNNFICKKVIESVLEPDMTNKASTTSSHKPDTTQNSTEFHYTDQPETTTTIESALKPDMPSWNTNASTTNIQKPDTIQNCETTTKRPDVTDIILISVAVISLVVAIAAVVASAVTVRKQSKTMIANISSDYLTQSTPRIDDYEHQYENLKIETGPGSHKYIELRPVVSDTPTSIRVTSDNGYELVSNDNKDREGYCLPICQRQNVNTITNQKDGYALPINQRPAAVTLVDTDNKDKDGYVLPICQRQNVNTITNEKDGYALPINKRPAAVTLVDTDNKDKDGYVLPINQRLAALAQVGVK